MAAWLRRFARPFGAVGPLGTMMVLLVALVACGGPGGLGRAHVETAVAEALAPVSGPGVRTVTCPDGIERGAGVEVSCTVELEDDLGAIEVVVRQIDDDGSLVVEPAAVVVVTGEVERELRRLLRTELDRQPEVVCGRADHRVVLVGDTFPCRATDGEEQRSVDVTVEDGRGTRSFEILPAPS